MRVVIQRVNKAQVAIDNEVVGKIKRGFLLLVGLRDGDELEQVKKAADKIAKMRIFEDKDGKTNLSLKDVNGEILSVSQFTLLANTKKGNRPSYIEALNGEAAIKLYQLFNQELSKYVITKTGIFGADMSVAITNDGPVTILLEC